MSTNNEKILRESVESGEWSVATVTSLRESYREIRRTLDGLESLDQWKGAAADKARTQFAELRAQVDARIEVLGTVETHVAGANGILSDVRTNSLPTLPTSWIQEAVETVAGEETADEFQWVLNPEREKRAVEIDSALTQSLAQAGKDLKAAVERGMDPVDVPDDPGNLPQIPEIEDWQPSGTDDRRWNALYGGDGSGYGSAIPGGRGGSGGSGLEPWEPTPWEPGPSGTVNPYTPTPYTPTPYEPTPYEPGLPIGSGGRDDAGSGGVSVDDGGAGYLPGGSGYTGSGGYGGAGGSGLGLAGGLAGGALGAGALGAAGLAAMRGGGLTGLGGAAGLGGVGGAGGVGGMGAGAGRGAGGAGGVGGAGRGMAGGLTGTGGAGAGAGGAAGSGAGAGAKGASGAGGGRSGMMGGGGMGANGGAGKDKKSQRRGAGGPLAPHLDDDDDFTPRAEGAQAGGRDEDGA